MTEQLLIDILFFLLYDVFNSLYIYVHLLLTLTPKYNKWLTLIGCAVVNKIIGITLIAIGNMPLRFVFSLIIVIVPAMLLFKDSWQKRLLSATTQIGAFMILDALAATIAVDYFGFLATQVEVKNWDCIFQALVFDTISLFVLIAIIIIWRKFINNLQISSMALFIIFPLGQAVSLTGYYNHLWGNINGVEKMNPFMIVSIIIFVISDIFMFAALLGNSKMAEMKIRLKDMEHEIELQYQYYENISNQFTEIREYRHDIKNLISAAEMVMNDNSFRETGAEMLESLKERAENLGVPLICRNPIVNAVIWQKSKEAEEKGIDFRINIAKDEELLLEKTDICSVVANLLDNAIREAENHENSFIEISAKTDIGMVLVEVKNTCDAMFSGEGIPKTTKSDGCHGYGLEIVDKIAKKYNGDFVFKADGKIATAAFGGVIPAK